MSKQSKGRKKRQRTTKKTSRVGSHLTVVEPTLIEHPCSLAKWELRPADASQSPVEIWDDDRPIDTYPTVESALARAGEQGCAAVWLWCLHCERFFQAKHLELDLLGNWQRCPYDDCQAAGFDIDIRHWSHGKKTPGWPRGEVELRVGMKRWPRYDVAGDDVVRAAIPAAATGPAAS